ncbi:MAG: phasin family protein [Pseudomonadales bacterium]|nr:phasin family protein [Pseudomonadales bacterium]
MSDKQDAQQSNPFGWPNLNIEQVLEQMREQFKVPGVDVSAILESERRNFEALQEAGKAMNEGWQALAEQQREIFESAVKRWQDSLTQGMPGSANEALERQSALSKEVIEEALTNMQKLSETAAGAQAKAFEVIRNRFEARMKELAGGAGDKASNT